MKLQTTRTKRRKRRAEAASFALPGRSQTRRLFLGEAVRTIAVASLVGLDIAKYAHGAGSGVIRLGLVGCGGRGTGATAQALKTGKDVRLVAMADVFQSQVFQSYEALLRVVRPQMDVPEERKFIGLDGYRALLHSGVDAVVLATPGGFRPIHFECAVQAGVHAFLEKPVAVDAPGIRRLRTAGDEAKRKGLSVVVGYQRRFQDSYRKLIERVKGGALGSLKKLEAYWRAGPIGFKSRATVEKTLGRAASEMEFQLMNWRSFVWLSGDFSVELLTNNIDICNWAVGSPPISARARVERRQSLAFENGDVFDFFSADYTYRGGLQMFAETYQLRDHEGMVKERIEDERGVAECPARIVNHKGATVWHYRGAAQDPYQCEQDEFLASIRSGRPLNNVHDSADTVLTAIMGRTAAYHGKEVSWEDVSRSNETFFVAPESLQTTPPVLQVTPPIMANNLDQHQVTRALGELVMAMGPPTLITFDANGRLSQNAWDPKESESKYLDKVKTLLEQGADPNALRISGYQPRMGWDSASSTGAAMTFALRGSKGELVASSEGGESLLDFCRKYRLSHTAALLQEHGAK